MPINPRTHFGLLHEHVELLVEIHEAADGVTGERLHGMLGPKGESDATRGEVRQLVEARILEQRPGRPGDLPSWQLTPATRDYVSHVLQTGALRSPESITAMVTDARKRIATAQVLIGEGHDQEAIEELQDTIRLVDSFRGASEQLGDVIIKRAQELKKKAMPVKERFKRIRRMWDDIVLPLYEHISPQGVIETTMKDAARAVEDILASNHDADTLVQAGTLAGTIARARRAASRSFLEAYGEVLRLYADPRNRERIEVGVEILISRIISEGVAALDLPRTMPISTFRMTNLMNDQAAARIAYGVAEAGDNKPEPAFDPSELRQTARRSPPPLPLPGRTEDAVADIISAALAQDRPVSDVVNAYARLLKLGNRSHKGRRREYKYGHLVLTAPAIEITTKGIPA